MQRKHASSLSVSNVLVSFQLTASKDPQPADCTIKEKGPGKFAISYTPISQSSHELRVLVGGEEIPGGSFTLPVLPPTPETREHLLHVGAIGLKQPIGVAVSKRGKVIVNGYDGHCIKIFSADFKLLKYVGSQGRGDTHFLGPFGLAVTSDDCILVADAENDHIQGLTSNGQFLKCIGSRRFSPLQVRWRKGIAVHPS